MTSNTPTHADHEHRDISTRAVVGSALALVIACVVISIVVWWLYGYLRIQDEARDARRSLIPAQPPVPPEPRLQVDPSEDFQKFKQEQDQILNSYGWVSRDAGRVHIPVERAMDLIIERGLPARQKTPARQKAEDKK